MWTLLLVLTPGVPAVARDLQSWRGGTTPPLELRDLGGKTHRLADYRSKVVLINFWATWCEPCRDKMPSIQQLKDKFSGKPFVVLAVNVGEFEARIEDFLHRLPLDFTVLRDHSSATMKAWWVQALPASFVVGPDGRIRYSVVGEFDWTGAAVVRMLIKLMPVK